MNIPFWESDREEVVEVKAAPVLRVTSVGQELVVENNSSANGDGQENIGDAIHLKNKVGLALGDKWTFDLMARKTWQASTDDVNVYDKFGEPTGEKWDGMKSNGHRIDLQATRHFENFSVGLKWRGEQDADKFYLPVSYKYGMFSGFVTPGYAFYDNGQDAFYLEAEPVQLSYGPFQLAYYFEGEQFTGDGARTEYEPGLFADRDHWYVHQARLRATLFSNDTFTVGAEYRYQFASDDVYKDREVGYEGKEFVFENNRHIAILNASYNVTENLTLAGYYQYEFNKYDNRYDGEKIETADDYFGEFGLGWTYNF